MAVFSAIVGEVSKQVTNKGTAVDPLFLANSASCFSLVIGCLMVIYGLNNLR